MQMTIKLLRPDAKAPARANPDDSGADLVVLDDVMMSPGVPTLIRHGFSIGIPPTLEGQIRSRSSTLGRHGLLVHFGTIDSGYRGEVCTLATNMATDTICLRKGEKISQLVLAPVLIPVFVVVAELDETERGAGGFGSTDEVAS